MVRVGIGGWTYPPWRGSFYPAELPQRCELQYAASRLGSIEINATYYRLQKPESFARWRDAAPADFVFTVKASRYCTNRKRLAEAGESVMKFLDQGLVELGEKLGPILWQLAPTKRFEAGDLEAFLKLLPDAHEGLRLRHALEVRHQSFAAPEFVELMRARGAAIVVADHDEHPQIADPTAGFVYARLMRARAAVKSGYPGAGLDKWARIAKSWADGHAPEGLSYRAGKAGAAKGHDVFVFMIDGAKERAPSAALALIERL
ncbi:MAG: DUF72 domain-containing protein [Sphingomonadaceae bacterium]